MMNQLKNQFTEFVSFVKNTNTIFVEQLKNTQKEYTENIEKVGFFETIFPHQAKKRREITTSIHEDSSNKNLLLQSLEDMN
jgi:hypothetical protein